MNIINNVMKEVTTVLSLLLFVTILGNCGVSAQLTTISKCSPTPTGLASPSSVSDVAGTWYIYVTDYASFKYDLRCGVCQIKSSGTPNMQCITLKKIGIPYFFVYSTGTLTYASGIFKFTGTNPTSSSSSFDFEFVVSTWNTAKSSMVITLCNKVNIVFQTTYQKVKVGLAQGCDISTLTDITGTKTDVAYDGTTCFKHTFDFTKTPGQLTESVTTTEKRDTSIFATSGKTLNDACVASCQCTVITNLVCTSSKCACKTGYCPVSSACKAQVALGETCEDNCMCSGSNQECTGTPKKCACKSGYCDDGNKNCKLEGKKYDDACEASCQCTVTGNTQCTSSKCKCKSGFCYQTSTTSCIAVKKLGDACVDSCQCSDGNQKCDTTCKCNTGYCDVGGQKCEADNKKHGDSCTNSCQCKETQQECSSTTPKKCACKTGYAYVTSESKCMEEKTNGQTCVGSEQCKEVPKICRTSKNGGKKCACPDKQVFSTTCKTLDLDYVASTVTPGVYFRRVTLQKTWANAKSDCDDDVSSNSRLVVIKSAAENTEVQNLILESSWIGVKQKTDKTYDREDSATITYGDNSQYQNWYNANSHDHEGATKDGNDYIYMYASNGKWEDTASTETREYVCEAVD